MKDIDTPLALMVWLMNFIADRFDTHAILKGGMALRLLDSPRFTNDIDYVFVPYSSKKDVATELLQALNSVDDLEVEHTLNSKCLRCICTHRGMSVQLEVNVARECETQDLTTAPLARAHNQQGRIIRAMRFDIALSHKLAAWNERTLIRDLYDCVFFTQTLGVRPHIETLHQRLCRTQLRTGRKTRTVDMPLSEFVDRLRTATDQLSDRTVQEQMRDYLPPEDLPGLAARMKTGLAMLVGWLEALE